MLEMLLPRCGRAHKLGEFTVNQPSRDVASKLNLRVVFDSSLTFTDLSQNVHISNLSPNSIGVNVSRSLFDEAGNAENYDLFGIQP